MGPQESTSRGKKAQLGPGLNTGQHPGPQPYCPPTTKCCHLTLPPLATQGSEARNLIACPDSSFPSLPGGRTVLLPKYLPAAWPRHTEMTTRTYKNLLTQVSASGPTPLTYPPPSSQGTISKMHI